jgi:hypothetical protein
VIVVISYHSRDFPVDTVEFFAQKGAHFTWQMAQINKLIWPTGPGGIGLIEDSYLQHDADLAYNFSLITNRTTIAQFYRSDIALAAQVGLATSYVNAFLFPLFTPLHLTLFATLSIVKVCHGPKPSMGQVLLIIMHTISRVKIYPSVSLRVKCSYVVLYEPKAPIIGSNMTQRLVLVSLSSR